MTDKINELQGEISRQRSEQLVGVRRAFEVAFGEYLAKRHELPHLTEGSEVDVFVLSRPELHRTIQKLNLITGREVAIAALEVLLARRQALEAPGEQKAAA